MGWLFGGRRLMYLSVCLMLYSMVGTIVDGDEPEPLRIVCWGIRVQTGKESR